MRKTKFAEADFKVNNVSEGIESSWCIYVVKIFLSKVYGKV